MTHSDEGHYAQKHPTESKIDPKIADMLKDCASAGEISCAEAHQLAEKVPVSPEDIGVALDLMEIRIVKCQLGLFGYQPVKRIVKPSDTVSPELEKAIREHLVNDRLPCASSWRIAKDTGLRKMEVAAACETLHIKITPCQLGAF